jgi:hypothetical protein
MHFDPEVGEEEELTLLRDMSAFLDVLLRD